MNTFSERYGYVAPRSAVIKDDMPLVIVNAVYNCIEDLKAKYDSYMYYNYFSLEQDVWRFFLNLRSDYFKHGVLADYISSPQNKWHEKLSLLEWVLKYMASESEEKNNPKGMELCRYFSHCLNFEFERLYYGYRIVDNLVVPITNEKEIEVIEKALADSKDNIQVHLSEALKLFSDKEHPDFRNSIKESISAVEALCRELTGEETLGKALKRLEDNGITIQNQLKEAFIKLYAYTNQPDTGIRHSLMDDDATYHPSYSEAYFMLVSCSAFINYLRGMVGAK